MGEKTHGSDAGAIATMGYMILSRWDRGKRSEKLTEGADQVALLVMFSTVASVPLGGGTLRISPLFLRPPYYSLFLTLFHIVSIRVVNTNPLSLNLMFTIPDSCLSASNGAVLASESFLIPLMLRTEARSREAALTALRQGFEQVKAFIPRLTSTVPGVSLVEFDAAISPRLSRVDVARHGKDYRFDLTFVLRCPIPKDQDFWARIQFVSSAYDRLSELVAVFEDSKGTHLYLEEARLDQQKEESDKLGASQK